MKAVIGIRREDKSKWERRVPLTPRKMRELREKYGIEFCVQPSPVRIFREDEFGQVGATVQDDLSPASVVFAVKEIPAKYFEPGKTYIFFAHVIKGQAYNMPMLKRMMELGCNLIDYEKVTDERGRRLIFFGWHAGVVSMIDSLWTLGQRLQWEGIPNPFTVVRDTYTYDNLEAARADVRAAGALIKTEGLPAAITPLIIGVAGYGNVGRGIQEILADLPTAEIQPADLARVANDPNASRHVVYRVTFKEEHSVEPIAAGARFDLQGYYQHPERYRSCFEQYLPYLTVLMNSNYWDSRYPHAVTKEQVRKLFSRPQPPRLRVIGDASCDIEGGIECTVKSTEPGEPVYVYDPDTGATTMGVAGRGPVILAVDILPSELPREASEYFSDILGPFIPAIAQADFSVPFEKLDIPPEIKRAVILYHGELAPDYKYIEKYLNPQQIRFPRANHTQEESMKKVVVFGAGLVASAHVKYLLEHGFQVSVASRTVSKAQKLVGDHPNGRAIVFDIEKEGDARLGEIVAQHDLAVSLLPFIYHPRVAKAAIRAGKHMVTASYVKDEMRALDGDAKQAGVTILNEVGVDPGIDHMTAMKVIHRVQNGGGQVTSFTSYCGGLPAPEANTNPFGYKFSWSPRGVIGAGKNPARFMKDGKLVEIPGPELFDNYWTVPVVVEGKLIDFEGYPNRDSLPYAETYGITSTKTMFRGTLRYAGWCATIKKFVELGLLDEADRNDLAGLTYAQFTAKLAGATDTSNLKADVAKRMGIMPDSFIISNMEWLGLFGDEPLPDGPKSPIDIMTATMLAKMQYAPGERDMLILQHEFIAEYPNKKEKITSTMIDFGIPHGDTSMNRTVGLPAAVGARMILEGKITTTGVLMPVTPEIYEPVLEELERLGIHFMEKTETLQERKPRARRKPKAVARKPKAAVRKPKTVSRKPKPAAKGKPKVTARKPKKTASKRPATGRKPK